MCCLHDLQSILCIFYGGSYLLDISYFILLIILMIVREIFIYMYISLLAYKFHATFDVLYISKNTKENKTYKHVTLIILVCLDI
jgi:hypothetical protein